MKKYISISLVILIVILMTAIVVSYKTSYSALYTDKVLTQDEEIQDAFKEYEIVNCEFNLKNPKHAFVSFQHYIYSEDNSEMKFWRIDFYDLNRKSFFSQSWNILRTGGTTITNTTFPELVEMVKEDCRQFQEDFDAEDPETQIDWGYREADPPEPPKTEEELAEGEVKEKYDNIRGILSFVNESLTNLQRDKFIEFYGDVNNMTNEEIYQIYLQLMVSGQMLVDESLHEFFYNEYGLKYMEYE